MSLRKNRPARSVGALALSRIPATLQQLSDALGVAIATASGYRRGEFLPSPEVREKIERLYEIPAGAWDEAPEPRAQAPEIPADDPGASLADRVRSAAETTLRQLQAMQARAYSDSGITELERARVLESTARQIKLLGNMVGLTLDVPERQLLATPAWRALEARIVAALTEYPEAAQAVRDAITGEVEP